MQKLKVFCLDAPLDIFLLWNNICMHTVVWKVHNKCKVRVAVT